MQTLNNKIWFMKRVKSCQLKDFYDDLRQKSTNFIFEMLKDYLQLSVKGWSLADVSWREHVSCDL